MKIHGMEYLKTMCGGCVDVNLMETVDDLSNGSYDICGAELSSSGTRKVS
jgi:hypothetical protein